MALVEEDEELERAEVDETNDSAARALAEVETFMEGKRTNIG